MSAEGAERSERAEHTEWVERADLLSARIESYRDEMVAFQRSLTAIRALGPENGGEGEWERSRFLLDQARRFGFTDIVEVDAEDERVPGGRRPNLILRVPGRSAHPAVWVMAHMDTVPPGETALWDSDPFVAEVCDGRIVGRGVEDNQQGLVAGLFALRALLDEGVTPTTDVRLLLVADEETGNARGVDHVLETRPALFDPSDLVIVPDAGAPDGAVLEIAEKSALWIRLAVRGKQVHASVPQAGVNAHRAAAHLVVRLDRRLHQVFDAEDGLFEPPGSTFEPTKREANVQNVNTIPGEDVLYFDCRILPRYGLAAVKAEVEEEAREIAAEFGVRVDVSYPTENPAAPPTRSDAPVVKMLSEAVRGARGLETRAVGIGGGTVAAAFRRRGIPAVVWATIEETAHSPNEYCLVDNLVADAQVFGRVFTRDV